MIFFFFSLRLWGWFFFFYTPPVLIFSHLEGEFFFFLATSWVNFFLSFPLRGWFFPLPNAPWISTGASLTKVHLAGFCFLLREPFNKFVSDYSCHDRGFPPMRMAVHETRVINGTSVRGSGTSIRNGWVKERQGFQRRKGKANVGFIWMRVCKSHTQNEKVKF